MITVLLVSSHNITWQSLFRQHFHYGWLCLADSSKQATMYVCCPAVGNSEAINWLVNSLNSSTTGGNNLSIESLKKNMFHGFLIKNLTHCVHPCRKWMLLLWYCACTLTRSTITQTYCKHQFLHHFHLLSTYQKGEKRHFFKNDHPTFEILNLGFVVFSTIRDKHRSSWCSAFDHIGNETGVTDWLTLSSPWCH